MVYSKSHGVTFIELLVVLAIMGIAAAFVVPSFKGLIQDRRIEQTGRNLHDALMLARSNAVKGDGGRLVPDAAWVGWEVQDAGRTPIFISKPETSIKVKATVANVDGDGVITRGNIVSDAIDNTNEIRFDSVGTLRDENVVSMLGVVFDICVDGDLRRGRQIYVSQLGKIKFNKNCVCEASGECN